MFRLHLISSSILHPKKQVVSNAWIMFVKDVMVRCLWEQGVTIPKFPPTKKHKGKEENSTARFSTKKLLKGKHLQPNLNDIWHRGISKPPGGFNIQHGWKHQFHPPSLPPRCSRIEQDAELKGPDAQNEGTDGPATMRRKVLSNSSFLWVMFIIHDRAATYLISHEPKQKTYHYPYYPGEWQDFRPNMTCVYMHSRTYKCAGHSDANSPKADAQNDPNLLLLRYIYICWYCFFSEPRSTKQTNTPETSWWYISTWWCFSRGPVNPTKPGGSFCRAYQNVNAAPGSGKFKASFEIPLKPYHLKSSYESIMSWRGYQIIKYDSNKYMTKLVEYLKYFI